jgi:hypothetical protein
MRKYIIPVLFITLLSACELVIDVETPDFDSSIVFNSILQPDSTIQVVLSQDYYILDNELDNYTQNGLEGATVTLFEDDVEIGILDEIDFTNQWGEQFNGYYSIDHRPVQGSRYTFTVQKSGFESVSVSDIMPEHIPNVSFHVKDTTTSEWGGQLLRAELSLDDLPGDNYYELQVIMSTYDAYFYDEDSIVVMPVVYQVYINSSSLLVEEYNDRFLFSDDLFKDDRYTTDLEFEIWDRPYLEQEFDIEIDSYLIYQIRSCSKAYYQYYNSAALHFWNNGNPFAEPVHVYSNVENGYGILGSFTTAADTLLVY